MMSENLANQRRIAHCHYEQKQEKREKEQRALGRQDWSDADINGWDLSFPLSVMHFLNSNELRWQSH